MHWYQTPCDGESVWQEEKNAYVERKYGRMVRYKGGSSTTVNNSYTPTPGEVQLSQASADYAKKVAPNAYYLNDLGRSLLENSLGAVQVDFNSLNKQAQEQIGAAVKGMTGLIGSNNQATAAANGTLGGIAGQIGQLTQQNAGRLGSLTDMYRSGTVGANGALGAASGVIGQSAAAANGTLGALANGQLPQQYQANMEKSISSALQNTMGKSLSSLGNRGILNSSVTTGAMNDIQRNAADEVARQYQANINQIAGLTQQQNANAGQAANAMAGLAQQQLANTNTLAGNLGNIYNTQYTQGMGALGQQGNLAQQQLANTQGNNSQNSGLLSNLANMAGSPITLAAAAQEAAQNPAFRAWNSSMGLGSATTNALAGIAGKGTSTQTTTQSGGGGFFGGLLGGALGGASQALGAGLFCFPPGTKIKMADGTEKSIEHIEVGDKVMSYADGAEQEAEVVNIMKRHYADVYNIQCQLAHTSATLTQPFLMEDGTYKTLADMRMGDVLYGVGAVYGLSYSGERPVHDIEVSGANTYIADGFVARGGDRATWQE
ncbi:Hint domain-containing protein [uncultured Selenomonas sp.]|uniref:Hint domain-containing protein n=1 Tax=uncultured Selenomonas sp. TaxID=159275 RepID=UPI0028E83106|nr:Hint domain-containing protein [uncultured Selenomonas sp.]